MHRLQVQCAGGWAPSATRASPPSLQPATPPSLSPCPRRGFNTLSSSWIIYEQNVSSSRSWGQRTPPRSAVVSVAAAGGKSSKPALKGTSGGKGFGASKAPSISKSGIPQTCACGSKLVYRQCCEPYHLGAATPPDVEAALRARFCAFVKGRVPYLVRTFHPSYHSFKYEGVAPGGASAQLRRDVEAATKVFTYSNLKVLEVQPGSHPHEAFIMFRYNSVNKLNPDKNFDGSIKISSTEERSRFLREPSSISSTGVWLFADYQLIDYPTWMEDAKQAELRARGELPQPQQLTQGERQLP